MKVRIESEVAPLRTVVVHTPGAEVDAMVPSMMEGLLFDDILYRDIAQVEHAAFRSVLEAFADEVLDVQDLLAESLSDGQPRSGFVDDLLTLTHIDPANREELVAMEGAELARTVIEGRAHEGGAEGPHFDINPIPNLLFMRDPAVAVGEGIVISSMARSSRMREALVMRQIFRSSPRFSGCDIFLDAIAEARDGEQPTLEGGDVLVPRDDTILVGFSERTNLAGIDQLARALAKEGRVKNLVLVPLPKDRYTMHLDTVFTMIDQETALLFPPFFSARRGTVGVHRIELGREVASRGLPPLTGRSEMLRALSDCGLQVDPVPIGGDSVIDQEREQWTDGCNAFCVAPGRFLLYRRNFHTLETLDRRGYRIVSSSQFLARVEYYDVSTLGW